MKQQSKQLVMRRLGDSLHHPITQSPHHHIARGFMLIELLMAMFILALGLSAVAAIFPVAGYLQRQTFNDAVGQQLERNVEAIITSIPDTDLNSWLGSIDDTTEQVGAASGVLTTATQLPLSVRCYPTADPTNGNDATWIKRDLYWVPLFQDTNTAASSHTWLTYAFILAKQPNATYTPSGTVVNNSDPDEVPKIVQVSISNVSSNTFKASGTLLQAGDKILCNNGMTVTVTDVTGSTITTDGVLVNNIPFNGGTPDKIWYAPPSAPGQTSPTVAIKIVG